MFTELLISLQQVIKELFRRDDNWLNSRHFHCPHCGQKLHQVDHSPFYDEDFLFCSDCPSHVEISWYDPIYGAIANKYGRNSKDWKFNEMYREIESRLKPCDCGGRYQINAPRRCYSCKKIVIKKAMGLDLWPEDNSEEGHKLVECYSRSKDIWL